MTRIVLIGGHGRVALRLERLLADRGHEVDAIIRNPAHAPDVEAAGARAVVADIEQLDVSELGELFRGHDAIVWSAGAGGGNPQRTLAVDRDAAIRTMEAAELVGVRRYVMVSYFESPDHVVPESNPFHTYAAAKAVADEHLVTTGLDWTILGPSTLTDGDGTGRIDVVASESRAVDRADVAAVAAAALDTPGTIGRTIRFNAGETPIAEALG
jgi:uncharacterized protein YbjT (DUF2867 family)